MLHLVIINPKYLSLAGFHYELSYYCDLDYAYFYILLSLLTTTIPNISFQCPSFTIFPFHGMIWKFLLFWNSQEHGSCYSKVFAERITGLISFIRKEYNIKFLLSKRLIYQEREIWSKDSILLILLWYYALIVKSGKYPALDQSRISASASDLISDRMYDQIVLGRMPSIWS